MSPNPRPLLGPRRQPGQATSPGPAGERSEQTLDGEPERRLSLHPTSDALLKTGHRGPPSTVRGSLKLYTKSNWCTKLSGAREPRRVVQSSNTSSSSTTARGAIPPSATCAPINSNYVIMKQWLLNPSVYVIGATARHLCGAK
jgi:hypothetical protein